MIVVQHALFLEMDELASAGAFCRGSISAAELDAALGPVMMTRKPRWALALDLHRANALGKSIGPVLHQYYAKRPSSLELGRGVMDAFDLSLNATKMLIDTACDSKRDSELDAMFKAALRSRAENNRDEVDTFHVMVKAAVRARAENNRDEVGAIHAELEKFSG
jgi:hypothetical protein